MTASSTDKFKLTFYHYLAFGLFMALYLQVLIGLVGEWYNDDNYSHGFLIPLVTGYLLWKKRDKLKSLISSDGANWGLVIILFGMTVFVLANAMAEYFTLRCSLIITLYGLVWYLFGRRFALEAWFELLYLFFMVPLPYVIYYTMTFPMQLFATKVTVKILTGIGMSAVQQGNIIHLPGYSLEVAEACSGLRSLISLLALGAIYARMTQNDLPRQLILFLSTIPIAIAANIFRVLFTAIGAYTISRELAEEFLHELSGMMVFIVAFIMMLIWGAIIKIGRKKA
ncbi:MAG: exosortase/archaeosortase family protein [candidate division Zixibacteria bacterium]|nr:exosortase/archaeosortase family protein [candidate division Zixibacteria bacterium]